MRTICLKFPDAPSPGEEEKRGGVGSFSSMLKRVRSRGERKLEALHERAERTTLNYQRAKKFLETLRASHRLFSTTNSL